jgi:hypothetical protein
MSPNELICRVITHTVAPTYVSRVANVLIMLIDQVRSGQDADAKRGFVTAAVRCKVI